MDNEAELKAKVIVSGTLVYKDDAGNVVGTADFTMPMTIDQAAALTEPEDKP